jgi:hypothetical protein
VAAEMHVELLVVAGAVLAVVHVECRRFDLRVFGRDPVDSAVVVGQLLRHRHFATIFVDDAALPSHKSVCGGVAMLACGDGVRAGHVGGGGGAEHDRATYGCTGAG